MKRKKQVEAELLKVRKVYFNRDAVSSQWRTAFDQGVMQALAWALDEAKTPTRGFELRLAMRKTAFPRT